MKLLESPKFEWRFWITLIFGVTLGSVLAGLIYGQIRDLSSGFMTAILAAAISATLGGLILKLRLLSRKKRAVVKSTL